MVEFNLEDSIAKIKKIENSEIYFDTIFKNQNLRVGVLRLDIGEKDIQEPHSEDEIYYVIKGDGFLEIEGNNYVVKPQKIFFVAKGEKHKFHSFSKELVALYFFA